jgi:hypothetical protein
MGGRQGEELLFWKKRGGSSDEESLLGIDGCMGGDVFSRMGFQ